MTEVDQSVYQTVSRVKANKMKGWKGIDRREGSILEQVECFLCVPSLGFIRALRERTQAWTEA
jgi:hypothetical protein